MKKIFFLLLLFLISCNQTNEVNKNIKEPNIGEKRVVIDTPRAPVSRGRIAGPLHIPTWMLFNPKNITAFYSLPDFQGKEYIVTESANTSIVGFYVKSIRVARNCKIEIFPFENYRHHKDYKRELVFDESQGGNLPNNVNTGSNVSSPIQLSATSWKLSCK